MNTGSEGQGGTLSELAQVNAQTKAQAAGKPVEEAVTEPAATESAVSEQVAAPATETEDLIRIGDKEFKSQAEAIKYAEELQRQKELQDAHQMGVQEAIAAIAPKQAPVPEQEDNFEERFYTDPKGTLREIEERAVQKAKAVIDAEKNREEQWRLFFEENPDLSGQRDICEFTLRQNWDVFDKITDISKGRKLLAQKVRAKFQDYEDRKKPRQELPNRGGQVVSSGSSGVTPQKVTTKEEKPLDFVSQLRNARSR